jgi:hypothetical protein
MICRNAGYFDSSQFELVSYGVITQFAEELHHVAPLCPPHSITIIPFLSYPEFPFYPHYPTITSIKSIVTTIKSIQIPITES